VFLRVLHDALFSGAGSADLMLPRLGLSALFPDAARSWLLRHGAVLRMQHRVGTLQPHAGGWHIDGEPFERVVLAATPVEAARLCAAFAPHWSSAALALRFEPILTAYLHSAGARLPEPMLTLGPATPGPAQFVFDRGQLGDAAGLLAFVVSVAQPWVDLGMAPTTQAIIAQARAALGPHLGGALEPVQLLIEKRATFRCTAALQRPAAAIAPGLSCAADYVAGPYPATLEGAVRAGVQAVRHLG
jgi:hypothetical protein